MKPILLYSPELHRDLTLTVLCETAVYETSKAFSRGVNDRRKQGIERYSWDLLQAYALMKQLSPESAVCAFADEQIAELGQTEFLRRAMAYVVPKLRTTLASGLDARKLCALVVKLHVASDVVQEFARHALRPDVELFKVIAGFNKMVETVDCAVNKLVRDGKGNEVARFLSKASKIMKRDFLERQARSYCLCPDTKLSEVSQPCTKSDTSWTQPARRRQKELC